MKALILAVHRAVSEHYHRTKPCHVDFVKFTIRFNSQGHVTQIAYTPPIPEEYENDLIERVKCVSEPHGKQLAGMLAHVVVGFKSPSRN